MRVLNGCAGLGGNRGKWVNCKVTAVEKDEKIAKVYKANFPEDEVVIGDIYQYLKDHYHEFDFIWMSPPCQKHSKMMKATRHKVADYPDFKLYEVIIFLKHFFKGKWVVENVKPYYEPLIKPSRALGRHLFWSNFPISDFNILNMPNFIKADSPKEVQAMKDWLGIQYEGNIYYGKNHSPAQVLRNCVHPSVGLHIFECAKQEYQLTF
jgi:DNA (cytosine-5)-methyltransferase 1